VCGEIRIDRSDGCSDAAHLQLISTLRDAGACHRIASAFGSKGKSGPQSICRSHARSILASVAKVALTILASFTEYVNRIRDSSDTSRNS